MNYFNWQKIHKGALTPKAQPDYQLNLMAPSDSKLWLENLHRRAWAELRRICLQEELDRLQRLAHKYETGERLHDTFYISHS